MATKQKPIEAVSSRLAELEEDRTTWNSHWIDLRDHFAPFSGRMLKGDDKGRENNGSKRNDKVIDGTTIMALKVFGAGIHSGASSPARPWFKAGLDDRELETFGPAKEWLYLVERAIYRAFARSNFYNSLHTVYEELGCFGTGAMGIYESFEYGIRCRPYTIGEYYISCNEDLNVDTFYLKEWQTVRQMIASYGEDRVSDTVKRLNDDHHTEQRVLTIKAIEPNDNRIDLKGNLMPFRSIHFESGSRETKDILRSSGYEEFPIMTPRWEVTARDAYGIGPCMSVLGDGKMLQAMQIDSLEGIRKGVKPPLKVPAGLRGQTVNAMPNGITYGSDRDNRDSLGPLYQVNLDIASVENKIALVQNAIRTGLYNDLFMMISQGTGSTKRMTATEIAERHEEKLLMLGPAMERLQNELYNPAIGRTFNILSRNNQLPPPPPELQGRQLRIEYISILAQAQKLVGLTAIDQLAGYVGNLSGVFPEVRHKFNAMRSVDEYADALGTPPTLIVPDEEADDAWQAELAQAAQAQNMQMGAQAAQSAKVLADTDISNENNLLNQLTGGL